MVEIKCITDDVGNELLPNFINTVLYKDEFESDLTKRQEQLIMLYIAITKVENYWYFNTPTAFGNPDFSMAKGIVSGMIAGLGWDYQEAEGWIIIKSGKRTIMKIQKPKKPKAYFDARRENAEVLNALGL